MKILINGIAVNYEINGSGDWFTLIHGSGDNLDTWYNQVPEFSKLFKVLTYDVRGHGYTDMPEEEITTQQLVHDLYALLTELNIYKTILLGYSMGGKIATLFTLAYPDMVTALIVTNTGLSGLARGRPQSTAKPVTGTDADRPLDIEDSIKTRLRMFFSPGFIEHNPDVADKYGQALLHNNAEIYPKIARWRVADMATRSELPDLSAILCPTLVIAGEHDPIFGPGPAHEIHKAIQNSQIVVLPTGHPSALEKPREFNEAVLKFLEEAGL